MPLDGHIWRMLHVAIDKEDQRTKLFVATVDGVRVHCQQIWGPEHDDCSPRTLFRERFYTTDPDRAHRTLDAALAAAMEPVEPNDP